MKIIIGCLGIISSSLAGLFLYQNWNRTTIQDSKGNFLSLDLYFTGAVTSSPIGVSEIIIYSLVLGVFIGLLLPQVVKILKSPTYH